MRVGAKGAGVVVVKAKKDIRQQQWQVQSSCHIQMYTLWTSNPLQGLALTMGAISSLHCRFRACYWHQFTSYVYIWSVKSTLEKQTSWHWPTEAASMHSYLVRL